MTTMTLRIPDDLDPSIRAGAEAAGLSLNAYIVRAARRQAVLDAAQRLAALGLGDDLCDEGDSL
ncbi:toxin-antitoxin system HicB family antitoxin [Streptomyces flavidovirens]|uniref:Toxin-antitoxin system HicB family antitoxin n=1 Tax=Streptomyces flavidovirens TaxID=67298 RepID=A0ABW6RNP1_9ACTN